VCVQCACGFEAGRLTPTLPAETREMWAWVFTNEFRRVEAHGWSTHRVGRQTIGLGWVCVSGLARTWEAANESLTTIVTAYSTLLLIVLDGFVTKQPDEPVAE